LPTKGGVLQIRAGKSAETDKQRRPKERHPVRQSAGEYEKIVWPKGRKKILQQEGTGRILRQAGIQEKNR
jgi:hypothetical protein